MLTQSRASSASAAGGSPGCRGCRRTTSIERSHRTHQDGDFDILRDVTKRPVHLRPKFILLVLLGGALGTATRQGLSLTVPQETGVPWTIFAINIIGSFLLGLLLESLIRNGPDVSRRRFARLLLGTGFLGGFTTYSALAVDVALLFENGAHSSAIIYSIGSLIVGMVAALLGILLGTTLSRGIRS